MTQRISALRAPFFVLVALVVLFAHFALVGCSTTSGGGEHYLPEGASGPKLEFDSNQLMLWNSDKLNEEIKKRIQKANDAQAAQEDDEEATGIAVEPEALEALKAAMRIVLSRPDQDGSRSPNFQRVRRELLDLNSHEKALLELNDEAIAALQRGGSPRAQATYIYLLENLMAEVKPDMENNPSYKLVIERIRDARIEISDKVRSQLKLRTMAPPVSPSDTASKILPYSKKK